MERGDVCAGPVALAAGFRPSGTDKEFFEMVGGLIARLGGAERNVFEISGVVPEAYQRILFGMAEYMAAGLPGGTQRGFFEMGALGAEKETFEMDETACREERLEARDAATG